MSTRNKTTILIVALLLTLVAFVSPSTAQIAVSVSKTVSSPVAQVGEIVTYTICVSNGGDIQLINITVEDPMLGLSETIPILEPDEDYNY